MIVMICYHMLSLYHQCSLTMWYPYWILLMSIQQQYRYNGDHWDNWDAMQMVMCSTTLYKVVHQVVIAKSHHVIVHIIWANCTVKQLKRDTWLKMNNNSQNWIEPENHGESLMPLKKRSHFELPSGPFRSYLTSRLIQQGIVTTIILDPGAVATQFPQLFFQCSSHGLSISREYVFRFQ